MFADQALARLGSPGRVLDVGSGAGDAAAAMRAMGWSVTTVDLAPPADVVGDFMTVGGLGGDYDCVWASHVLEHQRNVGAFLERCRGLLRVGGLFAVTVPPMKSEIVGGHLTVWNAGLLLYNLILAGFDCRDARVGVYGYNVSVLVRRVDTVLPALRMDRGDVELLREFFPVQVQQGFDGGLAGGVNWG